MPEMDLYPAVTELEPGAITVVLNGPAGLEQSEALTAAQLQAFVEAGGKVVRPSDHGAAGDGTTDDTDELNAWLAAGGPGIALAADPGARYAHAGLLTMTGKTDPVVLLDHAELIGTAQATSALKFMSCTGLRLRGGRLGLDPAPTSRGNTENHHRVYLQNCNDLSVKRVHVVSSHATGILLLGCERFGIADTLTEGTRADGLHMTGGAKHGRVWRHKSIGTGDDGIAVVSYDDLDPDALCEDITVYDGEVIGQPGGAELVDAGGRGMTIVGGVNCHYRGGLVWRSWGAGVLFATEPGFTSHPVTNCSARGMRLVACSRSTGLDHGSVLISSGRDGMAITDVEVSALDIIDAGYAGLAFSAVQVKAGGSTGTVSGIVVGRPGAPVRLSGIYNGDLHIDGGLSVATQELELAPVPVITVEHGATAGTARPNTRGSVFWVGTVTPTNATTSDWFHDTDAA